MSIEIPGDEEKDEIEFPNGMKIIIDYGQRPKDFDSFSTRYGGRLRRIRLFNESGRLITQRIEKNKNYDPDLYKLMMEDLMEINKINPKIIF